MDNNNSSSEDEFMTKALREATDQHFLKESFFKTKQEKSSEDKNTKKVTESADQNSLRPDLQHKDHVSNIFGVSDAFQNFLTKSLSKKLDKSIKFVELENIFTPDKQESNFGSGIKLLSTFNTLVCDLEENAIDNTNFSRSQKRRKPRLLKEDDSVPCKIKIKEVAVNPEWILSKCDTRAWANRRKEAEFKYKKLLDGTLVKQ